MTHMIRTVMACACVWLLAAPAFAQSAPPSKRPWFTLGAAVTTLRLECAEPGRVLPESCQQEDGEGYERTATWLTGGGISISQRADLGILFVSTPYSAEDILEVDTRAVVGIARYRPFAKRGLFVSGGAGVGWISDVIKIFEEQSPAATARGLAVWLDAGWQFHLHKRVGLQVFGAQHVVALGDLPTQFEELSLPNVIGNHWSLGATIVIR